MASVSVGASNGNRTRIASLGSWSFTIRLYPRMYILYTIFAVLSRPICLGKRKNGEKLSTESPDVGLRKKTLTIPLANAIINAEQLFFGGVTVSAALKFMSFNLRVDNAGDGINAFTHRFDRIVAVLDRERPDFIGFQEVTDAMRARLRDSLPDYTVQGCGREKDYHGESMLIAYRKDEAELISLENLWLSPTPSVAGSTYGGDQSGCPRMFTSVVVKHDRVDKPFRFINTHLDHMGAEARYLGAMQIIQYVSLRPERFVLTGDFNATPDTREIRLLTSALSDRGMVDCTAELDGTFHDFGRRLPHRADKIDYIFTDGVCEYAYAVEDTPVEGQYYSDHNAVCALIRMD